MFTIPFAFQNQNFPPAWSPADLPGVYLWLDASDGITTSGGLVTSWVDKISSKNFTSNTTDKFTFNSSNSNFNNLPTLTWVKTNIGSGCKLSNTTISYGGEDLFYWGVYSIPTTGFEESMMFSIAGAGGFDYQTMFIGAGPQKCEYLVLGGGTRTTSAFIPDKNVARLFLGRRKNSSPFTNDLWDNRTTVQSWNQSGTFTASTLTGTVGNEAGGGGYQYQFGGTIAELGWCRGTVTDGDVSDLITYLTDKYNITLS
jgi:hypothetical protein